MLGGNIRHKKKEISKFESPCLEEVHEPIIYEQANIITKVEFTVPSRVETCEVEV